MKQILLNIHHGFNFRDMGSYMTKDGHSIKRNKIIRSGKLANLSDRDLQYLNDYGVKYDMDFRSSSERENEPDRVPDGVKYIFNPVLPEDETQSTDDDWKKRAQVHAVQEGAGFNDMLDAYTDIVTSKSAKKAYNKFFDVLLSNDKDKESVLFHCTAGKDRTGMGGVYFLTALGVDKNTILHDYLASNIYNKPELESRVQQIKDEGDIMIENTKALYRVDEAYLGKAMQLIDDDFGGINRYLENELKLSKGDIQDLRKIYLD